MDDLTFDFERSLDQGQQQGHAAAAQAQAGGAQASQPQPKNYRQTVCTYWLRGLCMKGDTCGFLHQFDPQRMPVCRMLLKFGVCKEPDCPYKHTLEEIKECNMYKLGFCIYGPACRFKHTRQQGPPPEPSRLEACKPREVRNINIVANQANEGIAQAEQRPTRRPRLTGPEHGGPRGLPAAGGGQQLALPYGGSGGHYGRGRGGGQPYHRHQQGGQQYGGPPRQPQHAQQAQHGQQQQQQQYTGGVQLPKGIDPSVLASVGQAHLPYGF